MLSYLVFVWRGADKQHRLLTISSLPCFRHLLATQKENGTKNYGARLSSMSNRPALLRTKIIIILQWMKCCAFFFITCVVILRLLP